MTALFPLVATRDAAAQQLASRAAKLRQQALALEWLLAHNPDEDLAQVAAAVGLSAAEAMRAAVRMVRGNAPREDAKVGPAAADAPEWPHGGAAPPSPAPSYRDAPQWDWPAWDAEGFDGWRCRVKAPTAADAPVFVRMVLGPHAVGVAVIPADPGYERSAVRAGGFSGHGPGRKILAAVRADLVVPEDADGEPEALEVSISGTVHGQPVDVTLGHAAPPAEEPAAKKPRKQADPAWDLCNEVGDEKVYCARVWAPTAEQALCDGEAFNGEELVDLVAIKASKKNDRHVADDGGEKSYEVAGRTVRIACPFEPYTPTDEPTAEPAGITAAEAERYGRIADEKIEALADAVPGPKFEGGAVSEPTAGDVPFVGGHSPEEYRRVGGYSRDMEPRENDRRPELVVETAQGDPVYLIQCETASKARRLLAERHGLADWPGDVTYVTSAMIGRLYQEVPFYELDPAEAAAERQKAAAIAAQGPPFFELPEEEQDRRIAAAQDRLVAGEAAGTSAPQVELEEPDRGDAFEPPTETPVDPLAPHPTDSAVGLGLRWDLVDAAGRWRGRVEARSAVGARELLAEKAPALELAGWKILHARKAFDAEVLARGDLQWVRPGLLAVFGDGVRLDLPPAAAPPVPSGAWPRFKVEKATGGLLCWIEARDFAHATAIMDAAVKASPKLWAYRGIDPLGAREFEKLPPSIRDTVWNLPSGEPMALPVASRPGPARPLLQPEPTATDGGEVLGWFVARARTTNAPVFKVRAASLDEARRRFDSGCDSARWPGKVELVLAVEAAALPACVVEVPRRGGLLPAPQLPPAAAPEPPRFTVYSVHVWNNGRLDPVGTVAAKSAKLARLAVDAELADRGVEVKAPRSLVIFPATATAQPTNFHPFVELETTARITAFATAATHRMEVGRYFDLTAATGTDEPDLWLARLEVQGPNVAVELGAEFFPQLDADQLRAAPANSDWIPFLIGPAARVESPRGVVAWGYLTGEEIEDGGAVTEPTEPEPAEPEPAEPEEVAEPDDGPAPPPAKAYRGDHDALIRWALDHNPATRKRWDSFGGDVASDGEIRELLSRTFTLPGSTVPGGFGGAEVPGFVLDDGNGSRVAVTATPHIWFGEKSFADRPSLRGLEITEKVRAVMLIGYPDGTPPPQRKAPGRKPKAAAGA